MHIHAVVYSSHSNGGKWVTHRGECLSAVGLVASLRYALPPRGSHGLPAHVNNPPQKITTSQHQNTTRRLSRLGRTAFLAVTRLILTLLQVGPPQLAAAAPAAPAAAAATGSRPTRPLSLSQVKQRTKRAKGPREAAKDQGGAALSSFPSFTIPFAVSCPRFTFISSSALWCAEKKVRANKSLHSASPPRFLAHTLQVDEEYVRILASSS